MSCFQYFTHNVSIGLFVVCGIVSISISAWQYQSSPGDNKWKWTNGDDVDWNKQICESWPYEYTRPFSIGCDGCESQSYCGWSDASTGYRLAIAIITMIVAAVLGSKRLDANPELIYVMLLINAIFWGAAFVIDSAILTNSSLACISDDFWTTGDVVCNNATFGVTIAVDIIVVVITFLAWLVISGMGGFYKNAAAAVPAGGGGQLTQF